MADEDAPKTLPEGHVIGGKYRVSRLLGAGGMGAVYEAENTWTTRRVAIKVLQPEVAGNAAIVKRFRVEAVAATKLSHPHIVDVLDLGEDATTGALFLVQEFLDGRDLRSHLDEVRRMSPAEAIEVLVPILTALVTAHEKGILHRDLKPENIFLVRSPSGEITPKLIDFGLALIDAESSPTRMTRTGAIMGTPYYMSPEQARGDKAIDGRADVWAIATVLYELLAGAPPFEAATYNLLVYRILSETPPRVERAAPEVPTALGDVIARALTPDLAARTPAMRALLNELLDCPFLPGGVRDAGLRERHRKVLPTELIARPSTPSARDDAFARTLTPLESATDDVKAVSPVGARASIEAAPPLVDKRKDSPAQRPTPFEWDRPSSPDQGVVAPPPAPSKRRVLIGVVAVCVAVIAAVVGLRAPTPSPGRAVTAAPGRPALEPVPEPGTRLAPPPATLVPVAEPPLAAPPASAVDAGLAVAGDEIEPARGHRARGERRHAGSGRHGAASASAPSGATEAPARSGSASDLLVPVADPSR